MQPNSHCVSRFVCGSHIADVQACRQPFLHLQEVPQQVLQQISRELKKENELYGNSHFTHFSHFHVLSIPLERFYGSFSGASPFFILLI